MPTSIPLLTGAYLIERIQDDLGGLSNVVDGETMLRRINLAKDKVRTVVSLLREGYFLVPSQSTTSTGPDYFPTLAVGTREYALPADFERIASVECTTVGYETTRFHYRKFNSKEFQDARINSNGAPDTNSGSDYFDEFLYTIVGNHTFMLAQKPGIAYNLRLWYERQLPDIELEETIPELLRPFAAAIVEYVVMRTTLAANRDSFAEWYSQWKESLRMVENEAKQQNIADAEFVDDFQG